MSQRPFIFAIFFLSIFVSPVLDPLDYLTSSSDLGECYSEQVGSDQLLQMYARHLILLEV
jgi:hypothetical protein